MGQTVETGNFGIVMDEKSLASITPTYKNAVRITQPVLSKFEKTAVIGSRAKEIAQGSASSVSMETMEELSFDPVKIATIEFDQGVLDNYSVKRWLPDNTYEEWKVSELLKLNT